MSIWFKEKKQEDNLICDICGYQHGKPDEWGIVIECADGVIRCKVCRGEGKFKGVQKRKAKVSS